MQIAKKSNLLTATSLKMNWHIKNIAMCCILRCKCTWRKENSSGAAKYRLHMHYLRLLHEIKSSPLCFLIHCVGDMKWPLDNKRTSSNGGSVFCGEMNRPHIRRCRELTGRTEGEKMAFDINGLTYFELESGFDLCKRASRALEVIV